MNMVKPEERQDKLAINLKMVVFHLCLFYSNLLFHHMLPRGLTGPLRLQLLPFQQVF